MDDFEVTTFDLIGVSWMEDALCAQLDEDRADEMFFPERGGSGRPARMLCARCPVKEPCLEYALDQHEEFGIWGGTSSRERQKLRKVRRVSLAS